MSITVHERPGVYSSYDASSLVSGRGSGRLVGLAAVNTVAAPGETHIITSYDRAVAAFGSEGAEGMAELIRLALKNGASGVAAVATADEAGYKAAFAQLSEVEDIAVVLCDSTDTEIQKLLLDSVKAASADRRERLALLAGAKGESVDDLIDRAKGLNSERAVLVAPGGLDQEGEDISGLTVAAAPLGGAELLGLYGLEGRYGEKDLDRLILGGVTPVEQVGGTVSVVRGVTTRTATGAAADPTWRDLATIRVVDDVIPSLRQALAAKFRRAKNTPQSRGAIRAQVVLELEQKLSREIITGYEDVAVSADPEEPTRCLVDFSFTVAHGLNQIWLTAHITV